MKKTVLFWLGASLLACEEPLKSVELIAEPRVLGGRLEVMGDPHRAAPAPGEVATVTFLLAAPAPAPSLGFALSACSAAPRQGGRASCAAAPFEAIHRENGEQNAISWTFQVPSDLEPSGRVLLSGVVCPNGSPDDSGSNCEGLEPGTPVQLEFELARDGDVNQNPELQADSIAFDSAIWSDVSATDSACDGLGLPEVDPSSQHSLTVTLDEGDRDALPRPSKLDPSRESLQLSHFISAGDISRAFETVSWDSDELERGVSWTAPASPGPAQFWFVLRDFRGGGAFVQRAVCVR